ncbi:MAG: hypothetical protein ACRELA_23345, partial [Candidatus Rokuibacteriota bacterium]
MFGAIIERTLRRRDPLTKVPGAAGALGDGRAPFVNRGLAERGTSTCGQAMGEPDYGQFDLFLAHDVARADPEQIRDLAARLERRARA